jgi:hypothetical protein
MQHRFCCFHSFKRTGRHSQWFVATPFLTPSRQTRSPPPYPSTPSCTRLARGVQPRDGQALQRVGVAVDTQRCGCARLDAVQQPVGAARKARDAALEARQGLRVRACVCVCVRFQGGGRERSDASVRVRAEGEDSTQQGRSAHLPHSRMHAHLTMISPLAISPCTLYAARHHLTTPARPHRLRIST